MESRTVLAPSVEPEEKKIFRLLSVEPDTEDGRRLSCLLREARGIARPRALLAHAFVEERTDDRVVIEGVEFSGSLVREKLGRVHRVYPYVVTCGGELDEWSRGIGDIVENYWADCIKEEYLRETFGAVRKNLQETRGEGKLAHLSPGSLPAWPITEQRRLFSLLGDVEALVGVRLTPSCLMIPAKSVSGILFPTETSFENCMHCPRPNCPSRRSAFTAAL